MREILAKLMGPSRMLIGYHGAVLSELCHFGDSHLGKGFPGSEGVLQGALACAL